MSARLDQLEPKWLRLDVFITDEVGEKGGSCYSDTVTFGGGLPAMVYPLPVMHAMFFFRSQLCVAGASTVQRFSVGRHALVAWDSDDA